MPDISLGYVTILFGYGLYNLMPSVTCYLFLFLQIFGIRYYTICGDRELSRRLIKSISTQCYSSLFKHVNGRELPSGYFFCRNYVGYIDNLSKFNDDHETIYLVTTQEVYKKLVEEKYVNNAFVNMASTENVTHLDNTSGDTKQLVKAESGVTESCKIEVYMRKGAYKNFYYNSMKLDLSHINPIGEQGPIVDNILEIFKDKRRATVFIHGVTMSGKSTIGFLLAKRLRGYYCRTFNPTDPGDNFMNLMDCIVDDDDKPIIIVLEEIDVIINAIHNGILCDNKEIPTSVKDKSSWNTFLDDMIFYKNIILILTSNTPKKELDSLDEAYLNSYRVHGTYSMMNQLCLSLVGGEDKEKLN